MVKNGSKIRVITSGAVGHAQTRKLARARLRIAQSLGLVCFHSRGAQGELAASSHGVAGVDRQVHEDLLDHPQVGVNIDRLGGEVKLHGDVLADQALQHSAHVADDFVEVQGLRLHHLFAAESQQLAGQMRGALRGGGDLFQGFHLLGPAVLDIQEHARVALDDAEDIVEVVGDARGQLPHCGHALLLHDGLLALLQFVVGGLEVRVQAGVVRRQRNVLTQVSQEFDFGLVECAGGSPSHNQDAEDLVLDGKGRCHDRADPGLCQQPEQGRSFPRDIGLVDQLAAQTRLQPGGRHGDFRSLRQTRLFGQWQAALAAGDERQLRGRGSTGIDPTEIDGQVVLEEFQSDLEVVLHALPLGNGPGDPVERTDPIELLTMHLLCPLAFQFCGGANSVNGT